MRRKLDQPPESRLWWLLVPALVAPALALAGAALAGLAYGTTETHTPTQLNASDANGFTTDPAPADPPGPERFHSGFLLDEPLTTTSPDDGKTDAVKSGFGYGLRIDRTPLAPLPGNTEHAAMPVEPLSPAGTAPPQPEFTPD